VNVCRFGHTSQAPRSWPRRTAEIHSGHDTARLPTHTLVHTHTQCPKHTHAHTRTHTHTHACTHTPTHLGQRHVAELDQVPDLEQQVLHHLRTGWVMGKCACKCVHACAWGGSMSHEGAAGAAWRMASAWRMGACTCQAHAIRQCMHPVVCVCVPHACLSAWVQDSTQDPPLGLTQCGMYTTPSSATNSSTPQCVARPVVVLSTLNSMGYSTCIWAVGRDVGQEAWVRVMHARSDRHAENPCRCASHPTTTPRMPRRMSPHPASPAPRAAG
jgi:hypothetical protein